MIFPELTTAFQLMALGIAGYALWSGWVALRREPGVIPAVIAWGFAIRALSGVALFAIAELNLPMLRSLRFGDGIWIHAGDAEGYFQIASRFAERGWSAIGGVGANTAAPAFVQVVAIMLLLFGKVRSIAVLLNCSAYLATAAAIVRLRRRNDVPYPAALVALAAISFAPGALLWSTALLKDTFLAALIAAFLVAMAAVQDALNAPPRAAVVLELVAAIAVASAFLALIARTRWYVAVGLALALPVFAIAVVVATRRWIWAAAFGLTACLILSQTLVATATIRIPELLRQARMAELMTEYDMLPGRTTIEAGPLLASSVRRISLAERVGADAARSWDPELRARIESQLGRRPSTLYGRFIAGAVAAFVPHEAGTAFVHIAGSGWLWLIADADTILLDGLIGWALFYCIRYRRLTPAFLFTVCACVALTAAVVYAVTNFGSLFRLRLDPMIEIAMLPLLATRVIDRPVLTTR